VGNRCQEVKKMPAKGLFLKAIIGGATAALILTLPPAAPGNCARVGPDVITVPAPPGPPPEIRQVPPPAEIRQITPPEDMRKVAPPPDVAPKPAAEKGKAKVEAILQLGSLGLSSANPRVGERVFATATLRNKGSQGISRVKVRFFLDQVLVGEKVVDVAAGGSATASLSFKAAQAGAQNLRVQVDPGSGLSPLILARGLTVLAAAKTDVEDFTTPTPKATAKKELPPQRLTFHKPEVAKLPEAADLKRPQDGKGDKGKDQGTRGLEGIPKSPIPEDLEGLTDVAKGRGGKPIDLGDGIYGVEGKGTGIPAPPAGAEELDKLLEAGPKPGSEAGGIYGPTVPGIGPDKWAKGGFSPQESAFAGFKFWCKTMETSGGPGAPAADDIKMVSYSKDDDDVYSVTITYENDAMTILTYYKDAKGTRVAEFNVPPPGGGGGLAPEEAGGKPSPKEPAPELTRVLMKDPGKRKTDPRIGKVGDPPWLVATMTGAAPAGTEGIAAGGGKIVATWHFAGVKPGAFLKGPRDPNLPGGGDAGSGFRPDLRILILPDPPEAKAISTALGRAGAAGAPGVTVSEVAGAVQVLATQDGKQVWTPLTARSKLGTNSIIRVDNNTGGQVGARDLKSAMSMNWTKIHSGSNHVLYQLQLRK
jgi:hypothetical protein